MPYTKATWVDESLSGAVRYDIKEDGGAAFKSTMQILLATSVAQAGTSLTAAVMQNIEDMVAKLSGLTEYVITPSISSNNLTIAIKDTGGSNPSSASPLYFKVGNTFYSLTASTSYTKNAGTNWCNLGSTELATLPHDIFMYAIGETGGSAGLKFGFSRIPYARTMGDFINTTTSEKYIAGNWTNFNSTDVVQNIGRFRAQLSASTSFNWSIPTAVVVNRPIFDTDVLTYAPVWTSSTPPVLGNGTLVAQYQIRGRMCLVRQRTTAGSSTTFGSGIYFWSLPFTTMTFTNGGFGGFGYVFDNSTSTMYIGNVNAASAATTMLLYTHGATSNVSATVPVTLATSDQLQQTLEFPLA